MGVVQDTIYKDIYTRMLEQGELYEEEFQIEDAS